MESVTVTIGRGIGTTGDKLSDDAWARFRQLTAGAVRRAGYTVVVANDGTGEWEGITEENHVIVGIGESEDLRPTLVRQLRTLAGAYNQDAIACSTGRANLIEARS